MLSGFIYLGLKKNVGYKYILQKNIKYLCIIIIVGVLNLVGNKYLIKRNSFSILDIRNIITSILQFKTAGHLWFLYEMIAIYFFVPMLNEHFASNRHSYVLTLTGIIFCFILPSFHLKIHYIFYFGTNIVLFLIGGTYYKYASEKKFRVYMAVIVLIMSTIIRTFVYKNYGINLNNNDIYRLYISILLFHILYNIRIGNNRFIIKFINCISKETLNLYLFHNVITYLIIILCKPILKNIHGEIILIAFSIVCFLICYIFFFIVRKLIDSIKTIYNKY